MQPPLEKNVVALQQLKEVQGGRSVAVCQVTSPSLTWELVETMLI